MAASKQKPRKVHTLTAAPLTTAPPNLGSPKLTVGQIVEQLGPVAPEAAAMSERIRHWTREGLLLPVDQHHAGTGRHRRYGPDAVYEAAILNALATAGLQLVSQPYIHSALSQVRQRHCAAGNAPKAPDASFRCSISSFHTRSAGSRPCPSRKIGSRTLPLPRSQSC